jgi:hypothetical protein
VSALYVFAERTEGIPSSTHGSGASESDGLLKCATCSQLYDLKVAQRSRAEDVETHIQTLQSWINEQCVAGHPTPSFCTDGVTPCL